MANQFHYACPSCKSQDCIDISANVWVRLTADGTDADQSRDGSHEWDGASPATCECGWYGKVSGLSVRCDNCGAVISKGLEDATRNLADEDIDGKLLCEKCGSE